MTNKIFLNGNSVELSSENFEKLNNLLIKVNPKNCNSKILNDFFKDLDQSFDKNNFTLKFTFQFTFQFTFDFTFNLNFSVKCHGAWPPLQRDLALQRVAWPHRRAKSWFWPEAITLSIRFTFLTK